MSASVAPIPHVVVAPAARRTGLALEGIALLFLAFDTVFKFLGTKAAVDGTAQLGFAPSLLPTIAAIELACLVVTLVPRTRLVGAVLFTGYLGGAVCTHLRLGNPLFSHVLFPVYVAALLWGGLWLRDPRLRAVLRAPR